MVEAQETDGLAVGCAVISAPTGRAPSTRTCRPRRAVRSRRRGSRRRRTQEGPELAEAQRAGVQRAVGRGSGGSVVAGPQSLARCRTAWRLSARGAMGAFFWLRWGGRGRAATRRSFSSLGAVRGPRLAAAAVKTVFTSAARAGTVAERRRHAAVFSVRSAIRGAVRRTASLLPSLSCLLEASSLPGWAQQRHRCNHAPAGSSRSPEHCEPTSHRCRVGGENLAAHRLTPLTIHDTQHTRSKHASSGAHTLLTASTSVQASTAPPLYDVVVYGAADSPTPRCRVPHGPLRDERAQMGIAGRSRAPRRCATGDKGGGADHRH